MGCTAGLPLAFFFQLIYRYFLNSNIISESKSIILSQIIENDDDNKFS